MLVVDLPRANGNDGPRTLVLGPAIPATWGGGSVKGLRLRVDGSVDFSWDIDGLVTEVKVEDMGCDIRLVDRSGMVLAEPRGG